MKPLKRLDASRSRLIHPKPQQQTDTMTPQRAKELLPIITAFAEGKTVQYRRVEHPQWTAIEAPNWSNNTEYRIAPEPAPPRKVPLGPDDFPLGSAIRFKDTTNLDDWKKGYQMVLSVEPTRIYTWWGTGKYEDLMDNHEVYRPGLGWGPGFKMEE